MQIRIYSQIDFFIDIKCIRMQTLDSVFRIYTEQYIYRCFNIIIPLTLCKIGLQCDYDIDLQVLPETVNIGLMRMKKSV